MDREHRWSLVDQVEKLRRYENEYAVMECEARRDRDFELAAVLVDLRRATGRLRSLFEQDRGWASGRPGGQ